MRDTAILLALIFSAIVLYAVTALLFGSFTKRRAQLGQQFGDSGKQALSRNDSEGAIRDLRISLSYAPGDAYNRLLLAEALAQADHREEARSYFLGLLDVQPADGFINVQLARLSRQKNDAQQAIQYYRAAAVGNWNNAPLDARFQVQVELSNYLVSQHRFPAARAELLVAAADAPVTEDAYVELGDSFLDVNDQQNAVNQYQKAINLNPHNVAVLLRTGRLLFQTGRYADTYRVLTKARHLKLSDAESTETQSLMANSQRIQELTVGGDLPDRERKAHLMRDLQIAQRRFNACRAVSDGRVGMPAAMQTLDAEWQAAQPLGEHATLDDESSEANMTKLVFDTEEVSQELCGPPAGDDALLLILANKWNTGNQGSSDR